MVLIKHPPSCKGTCKLPVAGSASLPTMRQNAPAAKDISTLVYEGRALIRRALTLDSVKVEALGFLDSKWLKALNLAWLNDDVDQLCFVFAIR